MSRFILSRLLQALPVLLVIITLTFFLVRLAPGGPFSEERNIPERILEQMNAHYGLDDPLWVQYVNYLGNVVQGDLGYSYKYAGRSVNEILAEAFPASAELGLWALLVALGLGVPAGVIAAVKRNSGLDYASMAVAMVGICLPTFVLGPLLARLFGQELDWVSMIGWHSWSDRLLPALTLGLLYAAYVARLTRGGMLDVLNQDYIRTARAKGLPETTVVLRHALKGGVLPVIAFLGPAVAGMIAGSFVVETLFQIPGMGRHFVNAALNRDYTLLLGTVVVYAVLIIVLNLLADVLQALLNPRVRYG